MSTDAAAAFLRDVAASSETPPVPDLSAPLQAIWATAWQQAHDAARAEQAERVDRLTEDLAAATGDAEQQLAAAEEARRAQADAERQVAEAHRRVEDLQRRIEELDRELDQARAMVEAAQAAERAACTRADRAEATVDALQGVLATLTPDLPRGTGAATE